MDFTQAFWFARTELGHFGLHEHACFPTHFACFIGMHSGLEYTRVIRSKHAYLLLHYREHTLVMLTVLHFLIIYGELRIYTDDHVYSNTLVHLECFERIFR